MFVDSTLITEGKIAFLFENLLFSGVFKRNLAMPDLSFPSDKIASRIPKNT